MSHPESTDTTTLPTVRGVVHYLDRSVAAPHYYVNPPQDGTPQTNNKNVATEVNMHDLRGYAQDSLRGRGYTTDTAGFEVVVGWGGEDMRGEWVAQKWEDEAWIQKEYYADVEALVRREVGGVGGGKITHTHIFDHTVRRRRTAETESLPDDAQNRKPVNFVHIDQSRKAGEARILKHLGQSALEGVLRGEARVRLVNVWRPLRAPVVDTPLAYVDARTVDMVRDLVVNELRYPTWTGETLSVYPNPAHKWHYLSNMSIDETVFLKCYDSEGEVKTPHTAFTDPTTPPHAQPRWSIEVRILIVSEPTTPPPTPTTPTPTPTPTPK